MKNAFCTLLALSALALSSKVKAEDGWISLFNGKDLTGWKSNAATDDGNKSGLDVFTVENGEIKVSGGRSHLFYMGTDGAAKFKNFELKAKVKTTAGGNSGVYFHTQFQEKGWPDVGFECQVNSTHTDPKKTGSLYGVVNILALAPGQKEPEGGKHIKVDKAPSTDDQWFEYDITVQGNHVVLKVDGKVTVDWTQPDGFDPAKELKNMPGRKLGEGTIALQGHDPKSTTYYKDISIKALP